MRNLMMSEAASFSQAVPVDMMARKASTVSTVRRILDESAVRADYAKRQAREGLFMVMAQGFGLGLVIAGFAMAAHIL